jgi:hypothetical protein
MNAAVLNPPFRRTSTMGMVKLDIAKLKQAYRGDTKRKTTEK